MPAPFTGSRTSADIPGSARERPPRPPGGGARPSVRLRPFTALSALAIVLVTAGASGAADAEAGRRKAEPCVACHGPGGNSTIAGVPSLAGQPAYFTHWQLIKYRDGRRKDPQMSPFATKLSDADMADLAAYYAAQRPSRGAAAIDPDKAAVGRRLVDLHHCSSCHRPSFEGQQQAARLAGQDLTYLLRLIRGFKEKTASDLDGTMTVAVQGLTEADIEPLAHYLAGLGQGR